MSKQINTRIQNKYDTEANWGKDNLKQFKPLKGEMIIYDSDTESKIKFGDNLRTLEELPFVTGVSSKLPTSKVLSIPQPCEVVYTGTNVRPVWTVVDGFFDVVEISGTQEAVAAGNYNITFKIIDSMVAEGYTFEGGLIEYNTSWEILKAQTTTGSVDISSINVSVFDEAYNFIENQEYTIKFTHNMIDKDTEITVTDSKNCNYFTVSVEPHNKFANIKLKLDYPKAVYSERPQNSFVLNLKASNPNYAKDVYGSVSISLSNVPNTTLDQNSWEIISKVSKAGLADVFWNIGDLKSVKLHGTVGNLDGSDGVFDDTANNIERYVYIVDFYQEDSADGLPAIDFACFSNGTKIYALASKNESDDASNSYYKFNNVNWSQSRIRRECLGSWKCTKVTSKWVDDDTYDIVNSPTNNTLIAALPQDLRVVMRVSEKWTNNNVDDRYKAEFANAITKTYDYLPLLSAGELGHSSSEHKYENMLQKSYEYFKANAKWRHVVRAPYQTLTSQFYKSIVTRSLHYFNESYYVSGWRVTDSEWVSTFLYNPCAIAPIFKV